jgi:DNA-binding response OmpR family regulator
MPRKVLVVEDQDDIARLIQIHLEDLGCEVRIASDGAAGLSEAEGGGFDLIVLDLMLPLVDGLEICRRLRSHPPYVPILMVTARSSELDRVLGLELGADDYLTKPFSVLELTARVKALFRRAEAMAQPSAAADGPLIAGELVIDPVNREVRVRGTPVDLTAKEFDLLFHFARNPGRVYSRTQLLETVWGYGSEVYEHNVNTHISRLRAKIEREESRPEYILTVRGVGYKFAGNPRPEGR